MELSVMSPVLNGTNFDESVKYLSSLGVDSIEIGAGGYPGTAHINPAECLESPAKVKEIKDILFKKKKVEFIELFTIKSRDYIIVTFLSLLEMAKSNEISLIQNSNFDKLYIIGGTNESSN